MFFGQWKICLQKIFKKFKKVLDKPKDMWYNIKVVAQKNDDGHRKASKKFFEKIQKKTWQA